MLGAAAAGLAIRWCTSRKVQVWVVEPRLLAMALRLPRRPSWPLLLVSVLAHGLVEEEAVVRLRGELMSGHGVLIVLVRRHRRMTL